MANTPIFVTIGLFVLGIIIITALYLFRVGPYGHVYQFQNPQTWQPVANNQDWLTSDFDNYSPDDRNVPSPDIKNVYCAYDQNRCIPTSTTFNALPPQTCSTNSTSPSS